MKIVILDVNTIDAGDIDMSAINALGEVVAYKYMPANQVCNVICNADAVLLNRTILTDEIISSCKKLKYIGLFATGYNNVDLASANRQGIVVTNVPGYSTDSVAQQVFSFILHFASRTDEYAKHVSDCNWLLTADCYFPFKTYELSGKTLGIVGYGNIGKKVAKIADAFDMKTIVYTATPTNERENVKLDELMKRADFISINCPLTEKTKGLINKNTLSLMKKTAVLINTARGGVINEDDLAEALNSGQISGAGLDVVTNEPANNNTPLFNAKNCIITPHIAWAAKEARQRLVTLVAENLKSFQDGQPINKVN